MHLCSVATINKTSRRNVGLGIKERHYKLKNSTTTILANCYGKYSGKCIAKLTLPDGL